MKTHVVVAEGMTDLGYNIIFGRSHCIICVADYTQCERPKIRLYAYRRKINHRHFL